MAFSAEHHLVRAAVLPVELVAVVLPLALPVALPVLLSPLRGLWRGGVAVSDSCCTFPLLLLPVKLAFQGVERLFHRLRNRRFEPRYWTWRPAMSRASASLSERTSIAEGPAFVYCGRGGRTWQAGR